MIGTGGADALSRAAGDERLQRAQRSDNDQNRRERRERKEKRRREEEASDVVEVKDSAQETPVAPDEVSGAATQPESQQRTESAESAEPEKRKATPHIDLTA